MKTVFFVLVLLLGADAYWTSEEEEDSEEHGRDPTLAAFFALKDNDD